VKYNCYERELECCTDFHCFSSAARTNASRLSGMEPEPQSFRIKWVLPVSCMGDSSVIFIKS
jgi:hypothetical protein